MRSIHMQSHSEAPCMQPVTCSQASLALRCSSSASKPGRCAQDCGCTSSGDRPGPAETKQSQCTLPAQQATPVKADGTLEERRPSSPRTMASRIS